MENFVLILEVITYESRAEKGASPCRSEEVDETLW